MALEWEEEKASEEERELRGEQLDSNLLRKYLHVVQYERQGGRGS
jgi:hypothetical protein